MCTPDDQIGVVLFNTKVAKNEHHFVGVHQFLPLNFASSNSIEKIAQFRKLIESTATLPKFHSRVGCLDSNCENSLGDALWFADSSIRSSSLRPQDTKRVLLFTKSDSPFDASASSNTQTRAMSRASDMGGGGVQIELWHLNPLDYDDDEEGDEDVSMHSGPKFKLGTFYQEFLNLNLTAYRKHVNERNIDITDQREDRDISDLMDRTFIDCTQDCSDPDHAHDAAMTKWINKRMFTNATFIFIF